MSSESYSCFRRRLATTSVVIVIALIPTIGKITLSHLAPTGHATVFLDSGAGLTIYVSSQVISAVFALFFLLNVWLDD